MEYKDTKYFKVGRASDLTGSDRLLYRIFEIIPGFLSWVTIIGIILLSIFAPIAAAIFIIAFDLYWLFKTAYLSMHLRHNWKRVKANIGNDWGKMLENLKYEHIWHLVLLPFYSESFEVIDNSLKSLSASKYDKSKMAVVLASEEKGGEKTRETAKRIQEKYEKDFKYFLVTTHPANVPGEMPGKGSNISYAAERARIEILDKYELPYENVLVSAFDVDTAVYPQYFLCLTWHYLTAPEPNKVSFQPVPFYNNNIWQAPALSRVVATSSTFWQMIQQERPEKLTTFSSHSVNFKSLYEIGYWQKNMVSEDSRIFWNLFLARNGDYSVVPISYPVSMDANVASSFRVTIKNNYKQYRRWSWGVENLPYTFMGFVKNKKIPIWKKIKITLVQLEGFWSLATNPLIIFFLGWLPLILGGKAFNHMVLSYNLPLITRYLMTIAMLGLVLSAIISLSFLPPMPQNYRFHRKIFMVLQWILIPFTIIFFGAIPGMDSQTRLMLGKYLGFWVTPKDRKTT
jgi:hypothetical protein